MTPRWLVAAILDTENSVGQNWFSRLFRYIIYLGGKESPSWGDGNETHKRDLSQTQGGWEGDHLRCLPGFSLGEMGGTIHQQRQHRRAGLGEKLQNQLCTQWVRTFFKNKNLCIILDPLSFMWCPPPLLLSLIFQQTQASILDYLINHIWHNFYLKNFYSVSLIKLLKTDFNQ